MDIVRSIKRWLGGNARQTNSYQNHLNASNLSPLITPSTIKAAFEEAAIGNITRIIEMYDKAFEQSGQLRAESEIRMSAVLQYEHDIEPPDDATEPELELSEKLHEAIEAIEDLEDAFLSMAKGILYPFSCLEIEWTYNGELYVPKKLHPIPTDWFLIDSKKPNSIDISDIRLRNSKGDGDELIKYGWITHVHGSGVIHRLGLMRTLIHYAMFNSYSLNDFAKYLEIYGLPIVLGRYNKDEIEVEQKLEFEKAIYSIAHNSRGLFDNSMDVELIQPTRSSDSQYHAMLTYCDEMISKIINHGTLTTGTGNGTNTNALGNVHAQNQKNTILSDLRQYESTLNKQLILPILEINGLITDKKRIPKFIFKTEEYKDINIIASAIGSLVSNGVKIPEYWVNKECGIPIPKEEDAILTNFNLTDKNLSL